MKISQEAYNGAEELAWRIKEAINTQILKEERKENVYAELAVATYGVAKSMVMNILAHMLLEVDEETTKREEEYYKAGKQLEVD